MKFMCDVAKAYVCCLGAGVLLASSGLAQAVQPRGAKISAQTLIAIKKAVAVVQQGDFSAEEKQLLGFVPGLCAGVSELDAVAYAVTGKGFDYTSTYGALAYLAKKVAALQDTAPCAVKESYSTVAAALDTLLAELVLAADGYVSGVARSVTIDLSTVLEKLNEIQAMLNDMLDILEASSDTSESCCEHLTSLLEVVIANEETIIADVAAVQTTVNMIDATTTATNTTVNTINTTTAATQTTVNTINGTVNTINATTAATNTTVNNIQTSVGDVLAAIDAQSAANESCCEHLTSMLETVIANEETIIANVAAVQTTVNTIDATTTATNTTVNTINTTTAATQTTVNTINGTVNTINATTAATNTTVNNIQTSVGDVLVAIDAQSAANESCCEHLTSMLETVIANEEAIIADIAAVQTTVNTINTTTTTTNTTVNTINTTVDATDSKVDVLQSTVNEIKAGDCTPIYNDGANTIIISQPGTYCLAEDVGLSSGDSVVISIISDDVVLNLNGFEVFSLVASSTGIEVNGASSVVIKNGTVRSNTTTGVYGILVTNGSSEVTINSIVVDSWKRDVTSAGIKIENSVVVNIDEVTVYGSGLGLYATNSENIIVRNSSSSTNYGSGFYFDGCTGISMFESVANTNGSSDSGLTVGLHSGISLQLSDAINFVNCIARGNRVNGFYLKTVSAGSLVGCGAYETANSGVSRGGFVFDTCLALSCIDCVSSNNINVGISGGNGFYLANNTDLVFRGCIASLNAGGFWLNGVETNIILLGCQATQSSVGFALGNPSTSAIVQGCQSFNNTTGFAAENCTNQRYYGNVAFANTTADASITTPPFIAAFVAPGSATTWTANVAG